MRSQIFRQMKQKFSGCSGTTDKNFFEEDIKDNPKMVRDRFRAVLVHNLTKSLRLNEI